jgi:hypothetical protein
MNKIARLATALVTIAGLGLVSIQASAQTILSSQIDPAQIYASVNVNLGDSQEFEVALPAETFLSLLQRDTSINLDSQFRVISIAAPQGLQLVTNDNDGNGRLYSLERNGEGLKLKLELKVSADGIGLGSYPVLITLENTSTGSRMPVGVMVTVR